MKKKFLLILCILSLLSLTITANEFSNKAEVVVLLDNSGTMLPYYDEINSKVLTDICTNFVRLGDTFHLISFNEKPVTEIAQTVKEESDIYKIVSRFNLLYPLGPYSDFPGALQYSQQYISSLDVYNQKVLVIVSDGIFNPSKNSVFFDKDTKEVNKAINSMISKMKSEGTHIYFIKAPFPENLNLKSLSGKITVTTDDNTTTDSNYIAEVNTENNTLENTNNISTTSNTKNTNSSNSTDFNTKNNSNTINKNSTTIADTTNPNPIEEDSVVYEYSSSLEENESVQTSELIPDEDSSYNSDSFIGQALSMPEISTKKDLGSKKLQFILPITIKNTDKNTIKLELKQVLVNEKNVLTEPVFVSIKSNKSKKINTKISLPYNTPLGQHQIFAECVFADNVRTRPQFLDFFIDLKPGKNLFNTFGSISGVVIILLLILIAIIALLFILLSVSKKHKDEEDEKQKSVAPVYETASTITNSDAQKYKNNSTLAKSMSNAPSQSPNYNSALNSYTKPSSSLTLNNVKSSSSSLGLPQKQNKSDTLGTIDSSFANNNRMQLPNYNKPEELTLSLINKTKRANNITPASSSDPIESKQGNDLEIELFVEGQTRSIGRRNIHIMQSGTRRSIGGGLSSFSIFFVEVPASIAEIRYDGETCSLALLQPNYFPYEEKNVIENCLDKEITICTDRGYETRIKLLPYQSPTDKLNELLLSVFTDEEKKKYQ